MPGVRSFPVVLALVVAGTALLAEEPPAPPPLHYRFDEVRSRVSVRHESVERRIAEKDEALSGDEVETGWLGRAVVSVPERASRFEILSSTKALLGGPDPGVLVRLENGKLRAIFEKLTGGEERLVAAPGALLAVRGTRYNLEVDGSGNATLAVFEGTVEVRPRGGVAAPVLVPAGQLCQIGSDSSCRRSMMPGGMTEGDWPHHEMMDQGPGGRGGMSGGGHGGSMGGHHGGH